MYSPAEAWCWFLIFQLQKNNPCPFTLLFTPENKTSVSELLEGNGSRKHLRNVGSVWQTLLSPTTITEPRLLRKGNRENVVCTWRKKVHGPLKNLELTAFDTHTNTMHLLQHAKPPTSQNEVKLRGFGRDALRLQSLTLRWFTTCDPQRHSPKWDTVWPSLRAMRFPGSKFISKRCSLCQTSYHSITKQFQQYLLTVTAKTTKYSLMTSYRHCDQSDPCPLFISTRSLGKCPNYHTPALFTTETACHP